MMRPALIATCWTSAGDVSPLALPDERSPFDIVDRVEAVAATGWSGIGIAQDDLRIVRDTIGFDSLREHIAVHGLEYTEIEFLNDWWEGGTARESSDATRALLLEAAEALGAMHIKVGTSFSQQLTSVEPLVAPLHRLAEDAHRRGTRIALEPMPFSMVSTVPMGAELVRAVDHPACGIIVDSWHVFRAGTTLEDLRDSMTPDILFGIELDDADAEVAGTLFEDTINNRRFCGEGTFDLIGLVSTLHEIGYRGHWGAEIISREFRKLPLEPALQLAFDTSAAVVSRGLALQWNQAWPPVRS
jgi:sugar phosphate isomerase/epimerase